MNEGVRIKSQKLSKVDYNIYDRLSTTKQKLLKEVPLLLGVKEIDNE